MITISWTTFFGFLIILLVVNIVAHKIMKRHLMGLMSNAGVKTFMVGYHTGVAHAISHANQSGDTSFKPNYDAEGRLVGVDKLD